MQRTEITDSIVRATARPEADPDDPRTWSWVAASVWTDRMLAALGNGVRGGKWHSLIDKVYAPQTLHEAWQRVKANRGAAGLDRMSIECFEAKATCYLAELEQALREGSYQPEPVRRVHIPKGKGKTRPLGIATVKDRVVQTALKLVLEPIYEKEFLPVSFGFRPERSCKDALRVVEQSSSLPQKKEFLPVSFGFRPGRSCKDALRVVDLALKEGYTWVVDADLQSYFDTIPKLPLLALIEQKVSDRKVLELVGRYLDQEVMEGMKRWTPVAGTPQGGLCKALHNPPYA